jgi:hypothetical protein
MYLRARYAKMPNGVMDKLTSLEEPQITHMDHMVGTFMKEPSKLPELRVLDCTIVASAEGLDKSMQIDLVKGFKSTQSDLLESLGNLHKIRHLKLHMERSMLLEKGIWDAMVLPRPLQRLDIIGPRFVVLPSCINPSDLPNLTHLELNVDDLDEQGLKSLGALPVLCYLKLNKDPCYMTIWSTVVKITVNDGFFRKLRCLILYESMVLFVLNKDSSISFRNLRMTWWPLVLRRE